MTPIFLVAAEYLSSPAGTKARSLTPISLVAAEQLASPTGLDAGAECGSLADREHHRVGARARSAALYLPQEITKILQVSKIFNHGN